MKVVSPAEEFLALHKDVNLLFSGSLHDMFLSLKWIKALQEILKIMFSSPSIFKEKAEKKSLWYSDLILWCQIWRCEVFNFALCSLSLHRPFIRRAGHRPPFFEATSNHALFLVMWLLSIIQRWSQQQVCRRPKTLQGFDLFFFGMFLAFPQCS